jgi:hypothetical protein
MYTDELHKVTLIAVFYDFIALNKHLACGCSVKLLDTNGTLAATIPSSRLIVVLRC